MANARSKNAILNIMFGYLAQIGIIILSFIGRRIFLQFLSINYLGISGLYSNIITVLSLAELGLDTAVVFSLYKPVAEDNRPLINSLLRYFRKIYYSLAGIIFLSGVVLIPFLRFIVKSDLGQGELILYYVISLISTVATYFVAYKVALLSAFQEQRVQKVVALFTNLVAQILHIVVLFIWKSYFVYVLVTLITTLLSNVVLSKICTKRHKEIFEEEKTTEFDVVPIKNKIYSTLLYKLGGVAINNTDNILMSALISTATVGLYSNYYTVIAAVQGFISIVTVSLISGIGNLSVKADTKKQCSFFKVLVFSYHFVASLIAVGFSLCFNDLISIWLGKQYLFSYEIVVIIAVNFYLTNAISPVYMFREANGLFEKVRYLMLTRAAINIVLSIILGKICGVFGILLATAISLLVTNFWYEPKILCRAVFKESSGFYWLYQFKCFALTLLSFGVCYLLTKSFETSLLTFVLKILIITIVTAGIFIIPNLKTDELKYIIGVLKRFTNKGKKQTK